MSNLINVFDWKEYGINHDLDSNNKCVEHAIRASVERVDLKKPSVFDWKRYIKDYPDLERALGKGGPVNVNAATCHYLNHGRKENRKKYILETDEPYIYDFDWKMYDKLNPDVYTDRKRDVGEWHCFRHWCEYGYKEGRTIGVDKKLVVKDDASISTNEHVNKRWREALTELIQYRYNNTVDDLVNGAHDLVNGAHDFITKMTFNAMKDNIDNNLLKNIYQNIDDFSKFIEPYKNILFICSDYPSYGGAATNCDNLSKYYAKTHNVKSIYWTDSPKVDIINKNSNLYTIVSSLKIKSTLETLTFKPDIIILKNSLSFDLTKIFKCPTIFLVPGIYKNNLNRSYTDLHTGPNAVNPQNNFINQSTLHQIRNSTYSFCNSSHTQDILKNLYGLNTGLFCSTFIQFYGQTIKNDSNFYNRNYDYGLIISDFTRQIKNVDKCIDFLKNKQNVILIGSGSSKYKSYGFKCIELVDTDKMVEYYKEIKYIVQYSHFESCSNVMVEGVFNGCRLNFENPTIPGIVICSTQYPHYGGAATEAYDLHKKILDNGVDVYCYFFLSEEEAFHVKNNNLINPCSYPNIYYIVGSEYDSHKDIQYIILNTPKIIAFNYGIIPHIKQKFTGKLIYIVTGSPELTLGNNSIVNNNVSSQKFLEQDYKTLYPKLLDTHDAMSNYESLTYATNVYISCEQTKQIYKKLYPEFSEKYTVVVLEYALYSDKFHLKTNYYYNTDDFINRKYSLIAVASSWKRTVKNVKLLYRLYEKMPNINKIIIGTPNDEYDFNNIPNTTVLPLISNDELHKYLVQSKYLILPSYYENGSIVLIEALSSGCKVVTSKNVGLSNILSESLVCNDVYDINDWVDRINTYPENVTLNTFNNELNLLTCPYETYTLMDFVKQFTQNVNCNVVVKRILSHGPPLTKTSKICKYLHNSTHKNSYLLNLIPSHMNDNKYKYIYINIADYTARGDGGYEITASKYINNIGGFYYIDTISNNDDFLYINTPSISILNYISNIQHIIFRGYLTNSIQYLSNLTSLNDSYKHYIACESHKYNKCKEMINIVNNVDRTHINELYSKSILNFVNIIHTDDYNLTELYKTMLSDNKHKFKLYNKINNNHIFNNDYEYDLIYIISQLRPPNNGTKSSEAFISFVKYLKQTESHLKVCLLIKNNNTISDYLRSINYTYLTIIVDCKNKSEIVSKSKCGLITSSRDAQPRVLCELIQCNCYLIVFNTLTNGQHIIKQPFGEIVNVNTIYCNDYNCYKYHSDPRGDQVLFEHITNIITNYKRNCISKCDYDKLLCIQ
jgi:glycosyltransferase involved in cell wall biosynthesis